MIGIRNYFVMEDNRLQWTEFSFTNIRSSLSYAIIRSSGNQLPPHAHNDLDWYLASLNSNSGLPLLRQSFKQIFGVPLFKGLLRSAGNSNSKDVLVFYNPAALELAFKQLYINPDQKVINLNARLIYSILFREYVRNHAIYTAKILENRDSLEQNANDYLHAFLNQNDFNGLRYNGPLHIRQAEFTPTHLLNKTTGTDKESVEGKLDRANLNTEISGQERYRSSRLKGTILRRRIDGTLPVVLKILRTILHDYDPELYKVIGQDLYYPGADVPLYKGA